MRFYAERGVPVEVNESHQWSLRDAHDALAVAMAFLAAYNAKAPGRTPLHHPDDAQHPALHEPRHGSGQDARQARPDLRVGRTRLQDPPRGARGHHEPARRISGEAKGHMASSATFSMALKPHILHVVGFTEAQQSRRPRLPHRELSHRQGGREALPERHARPCLRSCRASETEAPRLRGQADSGGRVPAGPGQRRSLGRRRCAHAGHPPRGA